MNQEIEMIHGPMGQQKRVLVGLKMTELRQFALDHGLPWNGDVRDRLELCEAWWVLRANGKSTDIEGEDVTEEVIN